MAPSVAKVALGWRGAITTVTETRWEYRLVPLKQTKGLKNLTPRVGGGGVWGVGLSLRVNELGAEGSEASSGIC